MYSRNIMLFFPQASSNTNLGPMEACQPLSSRAWNLHEAQRVRKAFLGFWEHFPRKKTLALVLSGLKKQLDKLFLGCCWFLPCFVFVVFVCLWGRMKQKNDYYMYIIVPVFLLFLKTCFHSCLEGEVICGKRSWCFWFIRSMVTSSSCFKKWFPGVFSLAPLIFHSELNNRKASCSIATIYIYIYITYI